MEKYWKENSLDPNDWEDMKKICFKALEDIFDYLKDIEEKKVWKPISSKAVEKCNMPLPLEAQGLEKCYEDFCQDILSQHSPMNLHPGFWGWVMGCGNPVGVLAEMLAAGLNSNVIGGSQISCKIEEQVLNWFKEIFGFDSDASGILTTGCSMANLIALAVARNSVSNNIIRKSGLQSLPQKLVLYVSQERHHSIDKAVELLGIGIENLRVLPTDSLFRLSIDDLEKAIVQDRSQGYLPFCVIANVGTVNTGAIDDLERISVIAKREKLWFHIDGAFGALAALTRQFKGLVKGINLSDSLAFDMHKWMYLPYGVGCVIIKGREAHLKAFAAKADYINHKEAWFSDYGIELSRGFLALKVWMCLKTYSINHFAHLIERDIQHANYLAELIQSNPKLELLANVNLNIVCFRYNPRNYENKKLDDINKRIVMSLQFEGKVFPSETQINNCYAIRIAITNYRSREEHFDFLIRRVCQLGDNLTS